MWLLNNVWRGVAHVNTTGVEPFVTRPLALSLWYVAFKIEMVCCSHQSMLIIGPSSTEMVCSTGQDSRSVPYNERCGKWFINDTFFRCTFLPRSTSRVMLKFERFLQLLFARCSWISSALLLCSWPVSSLFSGSHKDYSHL